MMWQPGSWVVKGSNVYSFGNPEPCYKYVAYVGSCNGLGSVIVTLVVHVAFVLCISK